MNVKDLATKVIGDVETNKEKILALKTVFSDLVDVALKDFGDIIMEIEDEKMAFELINELSEKFISNKKLDEMIKLPFPLEQIDGMMIKKFRPMITMSVLKALDKYVLDRFGGEDWLLTLRKQVIKLRG